MKFSCITTARKLITPRGVPRLARGLTRTAHVLHADGPEKVLSL